MKNKLSDLNNYLFEQIEMLNDEDLTKEELDNRVKKAETISKISKTIIENSQLQLNAIKIAAECGYNNIGNGAFGNLLGTSKQNISCGEQR